MEKYIDENTGLEYLGPEASGISKAVKLKCLDCSGDQYSEVKLCMSNKCPLWPFRFGKSPYSKREMTQEQKEAIKERMQKMWSTRSK